MTDATFWDKLAPRYAKTPISDVAGYEQTLERIRHWLQPQMQVLEMGCGTGSTALRLAPEVASYDATDISVGMIEQARARACGDENPRFAALPAGEGLEARYDAVLGLNLWHLVSDAEAALARTAALLTPGGLLISKTALMGEAPWYVRALVPLMQLVGKAPYVDTFTGEDHIARLESAGFEILETLRQDGMAPRLFVVARKKS